LAGCGGSIGVPVQHFESIAHDGTLFFVDRWIDMNMSDGSVIPFIVNFDNTREIPSPYLGAKWKIPLLESAAIETSETETTVLMPNGVRFTFIPIANKSGFYQGNHGLIGKITNNDFEISAPCGGEHFLFRKGRLIEVNHKLRIERDVQGYAEKIIDLGSKEIKMTFEYAPGKDLRGIKLANGNVIKIEKSLAQVEGVTSGAQLINLKPALSRIEFSPQNYKAYDFVILNDETAQLNARTKFGNYKHLTWNLFTNQVISADGWNFLVEKLDDSFKISRSNNLGQKESWFRSEKSGLEEIEKLGFEPTRNYFFTTGDLGNQTKRLEVKLPSGEWKPVVRNSYDERGRLLRKINEEDGTISRVSYIDGGDITWKISDLSDKLIKVQVLDQRGKVKYMENLVEGTRVDYEWSPEGKLVDKKVTFLHPRNNL
jgi:hypothetical protein